MRLQREYAWAMSSKVTTCTFRSRGGRYASTVSLAVFGLLQLAASTGCQREPAPEPRDPMVEALNALGAIDAVDALETELFPSPPQTAAEKARRAQERGHAMQTPGTLSSCAATPPQRFEGLATRWFGECDNGKAHGRGILRGSEDSKVVATYYGRMEHGVPSLGAIEMVQGGFAIGKFTPAGVPLETDRLDHRVEGVNEAVAAAEQVSAFFERVGNAGSAAFYKHKSELLKQQVE